MKMNNASQLMFVNLELTLRCNLNCLHCGSTAGKAREVELHTDEWIFAIKQLAGLGCREVCILGGEPFIMSGWYQIAKAVGFFGMDLVIITNGWYVDQSLVKRLQGIKCLSRIGVSLDAAAPGVHDYLRGREGSFERAMKAIWLLRDAGFEVGAITSISRLNLNEIARIRDMLIGQNITWQIQAVAGHGERWLSKWHLSPRQHYQVAEFIAKSRAIYGVDNLPVAGSHDFGYFSRRLKGYTELPQWPGCGGGIASLGICSSGEVKPCLSQPGSRIVGNIRSEPLSVIWGDNDRFKRTRGFDINMLKGFCRGCPHAITCKGGCPNLPLALTGTDSENPFCCYRIEMQGDVPPDPLEQGWVGLEI